MSYTLVLNAGTASPVNLVVQSAGENAPTEIGTVTPSGNGADRTSVRAVKRNYGSLTTFVSTATKDSIIDLLKSGRQLPCSGDLLANIQKQCTVRYTGATMSPSLVDFWTVGLALNEVQPNNILLRYQPGDTITGESFTRSTVGTYFNVAGTLVDAAINVKRDSAYLPYPNIGGTRGTLLEDARTNQVLWSSDFSNAAWVKTTITVGTGIAGLRGGTSANTLTATGANSFVQQTLGAGSSLVRTNSVWIRRRTGTGTVQILKADNSAWSTVTLTGTYQRFQIAAAASTTRVSGIQIFTSGDAIDVENAQLEDGAFMSSEILTTTLAVTRGADIYSLPFTTPPQEMTVYAKFVEGGTAQTSLAPIMAVTSAGGAGPFLLIYSPSGTRYRANHNNNVGSQASDVVAIPALANTVELLADLYGDGSVQLSQSINSAATEVGAQSAALALGAAWGGQIVLLNSDAALTGVVGFTSLQSFKIVAGARSLAEMRAL